MKARPSQGRRLIMLLKRNPMTTMQMLQTGISGCPWKRIRESLHEDEQLLKHWAHLHGCNFYRVIKATRWSS